MRNCWDVDPDERPSFSDIVARLSMSQGELSWGSFTPAIFYAIAIAILFYGVKRNRNYKMDAQAILEPYSNCNRIQNLRCE